MKYRLLALFPIVVAVVLVALAVTTSDATAFTAILRVSNETSKALGTIGCALAALAFERGDYLRRGWLLTGLCLFLLLARDAIFVGVLGGSPQGGALDVVEGVVVLVANASAVVGMWTMARAWSVAGLALPSERWKVALAVGIAVVVALAISGSSLVVDARAVGAGKMEGLVYVASDVGDIFSLCLIAPILLTALALRGGVLRWPWGLLTAGLLAWLFYDASSAIGRLFDAKPSTVSLLYEVFRALACLFTFSAGVAQRFVVKEPRPRSPSRTSEAR